MAIFSHQIVTCEEETTDARLGFAGLLLDPDVVIVLMCAYSVPPLHLGPTATLTNVMSALME